MHCASYCAKVMQFTEKRHETTNCSGWWKNFPRRASLTLEQIVESQRTHVFVRRYDIIFTFT